MVVDQDFLKENVNRYRKLIRGEKVDFAPFRLWLDDTFVTWFTGIAPTKYFADFETMFEAQKSVNDRFYDLRDFSADVSILDIYFDLDAFASDFSGLGHTMKNAYGPCHVLGPGLDNFHKYRCRKTFSEIRGVKRLLEGIHFFNQRLPKHKQVHYYFGSTGAMDLFSIFRGTEQCFTDFYDNPVCVKKIFDFLHERTLGWLEFVEKTFSSMSSHNNLFDKIDIGEDYCAYLPSDIFDEFVVPYTGDIFKKYKNKVLCSLHTDGDIVPAGIGTLNHLQLDELMGFSPNIDIKKFREALPDVILGGNIHPIKVMIEGTAQDVKSAAKYCFENANQGQKFVLCTGGAISAGAKPENVDAFIESTYETVKY